MSRRKAHKNTCMLKNPQQKVHAHMLYNACCDAEHMLHMCKPCACRTQAQMEKGTNHEPNYITVEMNRVPSEMYKCCRSSVAIDGCLHHSRAAALMIIADAAAAMQKLFHF